MIEYQIYEPQTSNTQEVLCFLKETDGLIIPSLSTLVNLEEYAKKITTKSVLFTARDAGQIVGLTAIYFNKAPDYSYSTYTMVKREYQLYEMVGLELSHRVEEYARSNGSAGLRYEIRKSNSQLLKYHLRRGAIVLGEKIYPNTEIVSLLMQITY